MKRILLALAVGVAMFTVVAFAATLIVNSGGLQRGSDEVECDTNGVDVKYQNMDADGDYEQATVYGVDCSGTLDVTVEVQGPLNETLAYGTISTFGVNIVVPFSNELLASEISYAHHVVVTIVSSGP